MPHLHWVAVAARWPPAGSVMGQRKGGAGELATHGLGLIDLAKGLELKSFRVQSATVEQLSRYKVQVCVDLWRWFRSIPQ